MKKVYAIVLYYDKKGKMICREVNVIFNNLTCAKLAAELICEEKQLYYKLKEYIL